MIVFLVGSELFGESAGLLALLFVVFEPYVLANSELVTTDVGFRLRRRSRLIATAAKATQARYTIKRG